MVSSERVSRQANLHGCQDDDDIDRSSGQPGEVVLELWDAATDALQQTLEGHSDSVYSVAFSPDGRIVRFQFPCF